MSPFMGIGGGILTNTNAKSATFHAVVTRADGTVEDLGLIAYWHKNPVIRWTVNVWIALRRAVNG
jgi:hypothetical protein